MGHYWKRQRLTKMWDFGDGAIHRFLLAEREDGGVWFVDLAFDEKEWGKQPDWSKRNFMQVKIANARIRMDEFLDDKPISVPARYFEMEPGEIEANRATWKLLNPVEVKLPWEASEDVRQSVH